MPASLALAARRIGSSSRSADSLKSSASTFEPRAQRVLDDLWTFDADWFALRRSGAT